MIVLLKLFLPLEGGCSIAGFNVFFFFQSRGRDIPTCRSIQEQKSGIPPGYSGVTLIGFAISKQTLFFSCSWQTHVASMILLWGMLLHELMIRDGQMIFMWQIIINQLLMLKTKFLPGLLDAQFVCGKLLFQTPNPSDLRRLQTFLEKAFLRGGFGPNRAGRCFQKLECVAGGPGECHPNWPSMRGERARQPGW